MNHILTDIIKNGEGITTEFKECQNGLNRDVYDTVCSFLNRDGGNIFLGVKDDGTILGIPIDMVEKIKKEFITSVNNKNKLSPVFYLMPEEVICGDKVILHINVSSSSDVHRCSNKIFDRNNDSDIDITDNKNAVMALYLRKQSHFTENRVFEGLELGDFRSDIISRCRTMAVNQHGGIHPWQNMSDADMLKSAGLYKKDLQNRVEGYTLAAALLLGKDETIQLVAPQYRTDALVRIVDAERYDDRDDIRTNLVEAFDRLMNFVRKHLNDMFFLEGVERISIRDILFREIIANMLVHREYSSAQPGRLIIASNEIVADNSSVPHENGMIDLTRK